MKGMGRRMFGKWFGKKKPKEVTVLQPVTEEHLAFTAEIIQLVQQALKTSEAPVLYQPEDHYDEDNVLQKGLVFKPNVQDVTAAVIELKPQVQEQGYQVFASEMDGNEKLSIVLIKSNDIYDALRMQQTNAINYDMDTPELIDKLKEWENHYSFTITQVDFDFLELYFHELPTGEKFDEFVDDIYDFCPDIVEQGSGSIEDLAKEIRETNKVLLWWD